MPTVESKLIDLAAALKHETERAYLFDFGDKEAWVPKSLAEWDARDKIVTLPEWFVKSKDII